jgi:hypothetical protein
MADSLEFIINHVFMPTRLPQEDDKSYGQESALCQFVLATAMDFFRQLSEAEQRLWRPALTMLDNLTRFSDDSAFDKESLRHALSRMRSGGDLHYSKTL